MPRRAAHQPIPSVEAHRVDSQAKGGSTVRRQAPAASDLVRVAAQAPEGPAEASGPARDHAPQVIPLFASSHECPHGVVVTPAMNGGRHRPRPAATIPADGADADVARPRERPAYGSDRRDTTLNGVSRSTPLNASGESRQK